MEFTLTSTANLPAPIEHNKLTMPVVAKRKLATLPSATEFTKKVTIRNKNIGYSNKRHTNWVKT